MARKRKTAPATASYAPDHDYMARDDLHTLRRAHEIVGDKGRHGRARAEAKKQMEALHRIAAGGRGRKRAKSPKERLRGVEF